MSTDTTVSPLRQRMIAEWLADLLAHGLIRASFVPDTPTQELRQLEPDRKTQVIIPPGLANVCDHPIVTGSVPAHATIGIFGAAW